MEEIAVVNYLRLRTRTGEPTIYAFQNLSINKVRRHNGLDYPFLNYGISSGAGARGGDRSEATLVLGANDLSVNMIAEAVDSRWLVEIRNVSVNPLTFEDDLLISTELWRAARYELDIKSNRVAARLNSPLDSISEQVPKRFLSARLVGALPSTGAISLT